LGVVGGPTPNKGGGQTDDAKNWEKNRQNTKLF